MANNSLADRLAVCSWSLQPADPKQLIDQLHAIGLARIQLALDPIRTAPKIWGGVAAQLGVQHISVVSGMFGTLGEDYSTLDSIRRTGGLVPDETWDDNFAARQIDLALETGQETAATLKEFLEKLGRVNVGVNFDPANMILYDKGNPIDALQTLAPYLKQCHIKDARKTQTPGAWGDEVVVGTGEVNWKEFFRTLKNLQFNGYYCIEREAGNQRVSDVIAAKKFLEANLF